MSPRSRIYHVLHAGRERGGKDDPVLRLAWSCRKWVLWEPSRCAAPTGGHMFGQGRLSLEARVWERRMLREMELEDVPWNARCCCPHCRRPGGEEDAPAEEKGPRPTAGAVTPRGVKTGDERRAA